MRIPMRVDYSVRALVDLAMYGGEGPVATGDIAARQSIPDAYLEQLLLLLNRAGLVRSYRGPRGGYALARPSGEITLIEVTNSMDGPFSFLDCLEQPHECSLSRACAQRHIWKSVEDAIRTVLSSTTIGELACQQRELILAASDSYNDE